MVKIFRLNIFLFSAACIEWTETVRTLYQMCFLDKYFRNKGVQKFWKFGTLVTDSDVMIYESVSKPNVFWGNFS